MQIATDEARSNPGLYFAFTGFIIAVVLCGVAAADRQPGVGPGDLYLLRELALVGVLSILYVLFSAFGERLRTRFHIPRWLYETPSVLWFAAFAGSSWFLLDGAHNRFILVIALAEALLLRNSVSWPGRWRFVLLVALAVTSWSLSATIPFTPLKDWLLDASPSTSLAIFAFCASLLITITALAKSRNSSITLTLRRASSYAFATALFALAAFRTDHLLMDWIPYHRSYFADIADLVHTGHWLLWDVPSQYGFLSVLSIAILPGSTWQSLYIVTGIILTTQALVTFYMLYYGRRGWTEYAFALLLTMAAYFCAGVTRFPFDSRLYPQFGFRFIWTILMIFVAFIAYVNRDDQRRVTTARIAGYAIWMISVLWSFETALWGTITWLTYILTDSAVILYKNGKLDAPTVGRTLVIKLLPFALIVIAAVATLETYYNIALGHGPDFVSYFEFSAVYAADPNYHMVVDRHGPAWTLLLMLGALGSLAVIAARSRRLDALPLISTAWLATWVTTTYFVGEAFNSHVLGVYCVAVPALAVTIYLSRERFAESGAATFARLSLIPIVTILIAFTLGDPADWLQFKIPFVLGTSPDSTRQFPPISGELANLIEKAGIEPGDRVALPTSIGWTKLSTGWVLPFTASPDGATTQYHSWLPISPQGAYNTFESLALDRRQIYINRNLDEMRGFAWYITYREAGGCALISPRLLTIRTVTSPNFTASLCRMR